MVVKITGEIPKQRKPEVPIESKTTPPQLYVYQTLDEKWIYGLGRFVEKTMSGRSPRKTMIWELLEEDSGFNTRTEAEAAGNTVMRLRGYQNP